jgi:hypothetical protein
MLMDSFVPPQPHKVTEIFGMIIIAVVGSNKETECFIKYVEEVGDFIFYFQRTWTSKIAGHNRTCRQSLFDISTWKRYNNVLGVRKVTDKTVKIRGAICHIKNLKKKTKNCISEFNSEETVS